MLHMDVEQKHSLESLAHLVAVNVLEAILACIAAAGLAWVAALFLLLPFGLQVLKNGHRMSRI